MPRRRRAWIDGACYHITHRCHEREFLLKCAKHRDIYIRQLWIMRQRFKVDILDYMVTSNHVHLLLTAEHGDEISRALQFLHGSVGQKYNILKKRQGAFWSDRFHSTRIQSGDHLSRCLFYIDLNMIRAGAVDKLEDWRHCGSGLDNDATVKFRRDEVIYFGYLIWRKYIGDDCKFTVLRDGKEIVIDYKLRRYKRLVPRRIFDKLPTYYFTGGMLFVPLSVNHLDKYRGGWFNGPINQVYQAYNGKVSKKLQQVVVLSRVLAAEVNVGYQNLGSVIVEKVNDKKIKDLKQLISIVENCKKGFIVFQLKNKTKLVFDIEKLKKSTAPIMNRYRIPRDRSVNLIPKPVQFGPLR